MFVVVASGDDATAAGAWNLAVRSASVLSSI